MCCTRRAAFGASLQGGAEVIAAVQTTSLCAATAMAQKADRIGGGRDAQQQYDEPRGHDHEMTCDGVRAASIRVRNEPTVGAAAESGKPIWRNQVAQFHLTCEV